MITIKTIYELYVLYQEHKIKEIEKEIATTIKKASKIKSILDDNIDILNEISNYNKIILGEIKELPAYKCKTTILRYLNIQVRLYFTLVSPLPHRAKVSEQIKESIIDENVFTSIITTFNDKLTDELVYNRYTFEQINFGKLQCTLYKGKKGRVNWGKSLENKKKLIEEGKIPYYKDEAELIGDTYKGVEWKELHDNLEHLYMYWTVRGTGTHRVIPGITNYKFFASRGKKGLVYKLVNHRNTLNSDQLILYKQHYE